MKTIRLEPIGREIDVRTSTTLVAALLAEGKGRVQTVCGGKGICATCHVRVLTGGDKLSPVREREKKTLKMLSGVTVDSRLACQAHVMGNGVTVDIPGGIYLESIADLESLVGRRAEQPLFHPLDGRVLVPQGKIITRSVVNAMRSFEVDILALIDSSNVAR